MSIAATLFRQSDGSELRVSNLPQSLEIYTQWQDKWREWYDKVRGDQPDSKFDIEGWRPFTAFSFCLRVPPVKYWVSFLSAHSAAELERLGEMGFDFTRKDRTVPCGYLALPTLVWFTDDSERQKKLEVLLAYGCTTEEQLGKALLASAKQQDVGSRDIAISLLKEGAPVDYMDSKNETALFHAAKRHDDVLVRVLLGAGASACHVDRHGNTVLHHVAAHATRCGDAAKVKDLVVEFINQGAGIEHCNRDCLTPLTVVTESAVNSSTSDAIATLKLFLELRHCLYIDRERALYTALDHCEDHPEVAELFAQYAHIDNSKSAQNVLRRASESRNWPKVSKLVELGIPVHKSLCCGIGDESPVSWAIANDLSLQAVQALVSRTEFNKTVNHRSTPFHVLCDASPLHHDALEIFTRLRDAGCLCTLTDAQGRTPLWLTLNRECTMQLADALLDAGADPFEPKLLRNMARGLKLVAVRWLLDCMQKRNAKKLRKVVQEKDKETGNTVLHELFIGLAESYSQAEHRGQVLAIAKKLYEYGVSRTKKNKYKLTAEEAFARTMINRN